MTGIKSESIITFIGISTRQEACDISKFIEEAVRWRIIRETLSGAHKAFADVPLDGLQRKIDEAVKDVRTKRYWELAKRP